MKPAPPVTMVLIDGENLVVRAVLVGLAVGAARHERRETLLEERDHRRALIVDRLELGQRQLGAAKSSACHSSPVGVAVHGAT